MGAGRVACEQADGLLVTHSADELCDVCRGALPYDRVVIETSVKAVASRVQIVNLSKRQHVVDFSLKAGGDRIRLFRNNPIKKSAAEGYVIALHACLAVAELEPEACPFDRRRLLRCSRLSGTAVERAEKLLIEEAPAHPAFEHASESGAITSWTRDALISLKS